MPSPVIEELLYRARGRARALPRRERPARPKGVSFAESIRGKRRLDVIAEFKRASPSAGNIAERELETCVAEYLRGGAAAVSVLTEPTRFKGSLDDLERAVRLARVPEVPVLMKDFIVDPAQVREAAHRGARAVLLIVRFLSADQLGELASAALDDSLTPLVECHSEAELERALAIPEAVVGVNNRDLDTFTVDPSLAPRLLAALPETRIAVAESGYETVADIEAIRGLADAVLVGSALMRLEDPAAWIREVRR